MNILLAFDKFKGALTADEACRIAGESIASAWPEASVVSVPITDGGEGFCSILTAARGGWVVEVPVADPLGRSIEAPIGWVDAEQLPAEAIFRIGAEIGQRIAVIEMAAASGLPLLAQTERDPWKTSTRGTGELVLRAVRDGADLILLGVGGSATNDAGAGALEALGVRFLDEDGQLIEGISPNDFDRVASVDFSKAERLPRLVVASDVQSPLLGGEGATRVFGPQKGLVDVGKMESAIERIALMISVGSAKSSASVWPPDPSRPGMGAAGGISFGLSALAEVVVEPGFALVADWMELGNHMAKADWVLTGEGRLDRGSLTGKGPVALLRDAIRRGAKGAVFAGAVESGVPEALSEELGSCPCVALCREGWSLDESLKNTRARLSEEIGRWASIERSRCC